MCSLLPRHIHQRFFMWNNAKEIEKEVKQEEEEQEINRVFLGIMEDYKDFVIPRLSDFSQSPYPSILEKGAPSSSKRVCRRTQGSDPEILKKDRDRRGKMNESFSVLQSIVPSLSIFPKASKERIVAETTEYIKKLEEEKARLEGLRESLSTTQPPGAKPALSHCTNRISSVNVSFSGSTVFFGIQLPFQQSSVVKIFRVFENNQAEVLGANVSVDDGQRQLTVMVTALLGGDGYQSIEKIKGEILSL